MRWVEVELNGGDTTIEEALRAVERMRRPAIDAPVVPRRIASSPVADPRAQEEETSFGAHEPQEEPAAPPEAGAGADEESNGNSSAGRRKRGEGELKDRNAGIKPVDDMNFVPSNGVPLKEFFAEKDPTSDMDQILVLCYYLQDTLQIPKYGPGHILTGFRHVERPVPKDLRQTIRNMKKKAWVNFTDIEDIRLTTEGENRVKFGLGKRGKDSGD